MLLTSVDQQVQQVGHAVKEISGEWWGSQTYGKDTTSVSTIESRGSSNNSLWQVVFLKCDLELQPDRGVAHIIMRLQHKPSQVRHNKEMGLPCKLI